MTAKKRILVVDDTPSNIKVLNDILKGIYHVSVATNGDDALTIANAEAKPDLILLDIMMPGMDGYEVCRRLKVSSETSSIPVIFVTAKGDEEDESNGFDVGCVDYITKPVSPPLVLARVKTHLELGHALETLAIQNMELIEAAKLREEVEEITRHDLKNPLTGIFSAVDLMEMIGDLNPDHTEALDVIKESAHKILSMVNASLDLFKMERNIYTPEMVDVDMIDIIKRIEKEYSSLLNIFRTSISVMVNGLQTDAKEPFIVKGEMLLLYSMMANLIKNAIEAIPENETIHIFLTKNTSTAGIAVKNKGGIPEEIQKTFFDKYVTSGKAKGTGIGTYSAKLIARTLNGDISMTSSEEDGTTLSILLPL